MHQIALTKEGVEYEWLELHKWSLSQLRGQNIVQQYKKWQCDQKLHKTLRLFTQNSESHNKILFIELRILLLVYILSFYYLSDIEMQFLINTLNICINLINFYKKINTTHVLNFLYPYIIFKFQYIKTAGYWWNAKMWTILPIIAYFLTIHLSLFFDAIRWSH